MSAPRRHGLRPGDTGYGWRVALTCAVVAAWIVLGFHTIDPSATPEARQLYSDNRERIDRLEQQVEQLQFELDLGGR